MELGQNCTINPYGVQEYPAVFMGYMGVGDTDSQDFPVYYLDFYSTGPRGANCYMTLFKGKRFALGETIEEMEQNFLGKFVYNGLSRAIIKVGPRTLGVSAFREECKKTTMDRVTTDNVVLIGRYSGSYGKYGEIKACPSCGALRDTTCSACGCGSCRTCGYRWTCMPTEPRMNHVN